MTPPPPPLPSIGAERLCPSWGQTKATLRAQDGAVLSAQYTEAPAELLAWPGPAVASISDEDLVVQAHWQLRHTFLWRTVDDLWNEQGIMADYARRGSTAHGAEQDISVLASSNAPC